MSLIDNLDFACLSELNYIFIIYCVVSYFDLMIILLCVVLRDMSRYTGVREKVRSDGSRMYGCQIHIDGIKRWVDRWPCEEQAARAYDYFEIGRAHV